MPSKPQFRELKAISLSGGENAVAEPRVSPLGTLEWICPREEHSARRPLRINTKTTMKKATSSKAASAPAKKAPAKRITKSSTSKKTTSKTNTTAKRTVTPTAILAQIDVGFGNQLFIRGDGPGLSWGKGVPMECSSSDTWTWSTTAATRPFAYKVLVNDEKWTEGDDFVASVGVGNTIWPPF